MICGKLGPAIVIRREKNLRSPIKAFLANGAITIVASQIRKLIWMLILLGDVILYAA